MAMTTISLGERAVVWLIATIGFESILYFAVWWLHPQHEKHLIFFIPLTFAVFWLLYEAAVYWFYQLNLKVPEYRPAREGLSVDVFTTAAQGEPTEIFERCLPALAAITYPHTTYLLDGSGNPDLKVLAERLGARHVDCSNIGGAKAGKINHALKQTSGDYVLVIDPDHIAQPHFLDRVLGHFDNDRVGFVQVVQAYYNQGNSFVARAAAEQSYGFYSPILMGMNGYGSSLVIGANCTFRRKALESIGDHAVHLVEDFVTSIRLHARGWKSVYVPEILARGLVPEDLSSYFNQQLKWSTGMFQTLFTIMPKTIWHLRGWQKMCYLISSTYYAVGIAITINLILPIVFLFLNLWAVQMPIGGFVWHLVPFLIIFVVFHRFSQRWMRERSERGWQWRGMLLKLGTWPIYLLSLIFALTGVHVPYLPTSKTRQRGAFPLLVSPHLVICGLSIAAIIWALHSPLRDYSGTQLMMLFAALNVVLMLPTIAVAVVEMSRSGSIAP